MKKLFVLALALTCAHLSFSQTLVNQYIHSTYGRPNQQMEYIRAIPIGGNSVAVLDNSYSSIPGGDLESMHVAKYSLDSGVVAEMDLYYQHGRDFGTNLYSKAGKLYVTGFTTDSIFSHSYQCNLAVIDIASFDTLFTTQIQIDSAIDQMPFAVAADDSGNIYLGAAVSTGSSYKLSLLKLTSAGTPVWQTNYDSLGFYTLPVAMDVRISVMASAFNVTGFSFDNGGHSHFVTLGINPINGHIRARTYVANGTGAISRPVGIVSDTAKQSYVAGTSTVAGLTSVIKLVKYDSLFNEIWSTTWGDSTQTSTASFMALDAQVSTGHIFVGGTSQNARGGTDVVTLRFNADGSLSWARRLPAANPAYSSSAVSLTADLAGSVYISGTTYNGMDTDIVTAGYDSSGNLLWSKTYGRNSGSNEAPYSMLMGDNGSSVMVYGRSNGSDSLYMALRYDQLTKVNKLDTTTSGGHYLADQLIVRFDQSAVKRDAVNNLDMNFGKADYWLTDSAYNALAAVLPFDINECRFERIYKGLKTTYTRSLARNGDWVPIPDFWATFLLIQPESKTPELAVANAINTLWPMVTATNLNYIGEFLCNSNQTGCIINDPYFSQQWNLWDSMCVRDQQYQYHINIDSAWRLETGKPFVKVGVYDTGLFGGHEDFGASNPFSFDTSKVNGWDFYSNTNLQNLNNDCDNALHAHGTHVAGIIGAIRNNNVGIAGIAGGSFSNPSDIGVKLYGMKIGEANSDDIGVGTYFTLPISTLVNAYVIGSSFVPDSGYGYALNVTNHSYKFIIDPAPTYATSVRSMADVSQLEEGFHYMFQNKTVVVCAAGNSPHDIGWPACFEGDWILCVGGAADNGGYVGAGSPDYIAYTGPEVDVIAPSQTSSGYHAWTTGYSGLINGNQDYYYGFYGTSMAAPHVTGTSALLKSYLDSSVSVYRNLSPEDIEHIITRSAYDIDTPGKDNNTGWGDLNAGRALQTVNKACRELRHLGQDTLGNGSSQVMALNVPIKLLRRYQLPHLMLDTITYHFNVYKISVKHNHLLPSNFVITDAWTRSSSTKLLYYYDSLAHTLLPHEHLYIDSLDNQSVVLYGYIYLLLDSLGNPTNIALGATDSNILNSNFGFQYSLLLQDTTKNCYPTITTEIHRLTETIAAILYPNPTESKADLNVMLGKGQIAKIDLIGMDGKILQTIFDGKLSDGPNRFEIDTRPLASGVYFISINLEDEKKIIKFSKIG